MQPTNRVIWVDNESALAALARSLEAAPFVALDTEQDSFFAYRTKVCVIQVGLPGEEWIVDALQLRDLKPLAARLADPAVPKILHAADNDVAMLRRDCGIEVRGLFDTMAASSILGYKKTGLAGLIQEHFGVQLEKKYQRSDWRQRPLERAQIEYAALDVRFLAPLREILLAALAAKDRMEEAESDFRRLEQVAFEPRPFDADDYFRIDGVRELDGVGRRVLRAVYALRESIAEAEDRAPFRVCGDATLMAMAVRQPAAIGPLARLPGASDRLAKRHGLDFLTAIREAIAAGPLAPPPRKPRGDFPGRELDDAQRELFDRMRDWRGKRAVQRDVEPGRVVPNALLLKVARAVPKTHVDLAAAGFEPWRLREYGDDLLAVVNAKQPRH